MGEVGGLLGKAIVGTAKRVIDPRTGQFSPGGFLTGDNMAFRKEIAAKSASAVQDKQLERMGLRMDIRDKLADSDPLEAQAFATEFIGKPVAAQARQEAIAAGGGGLQDRLKAILEADKAQAEIGRAHV